MVTTANKEVYVLEKQVAMATILEYKILEDWDHFQNFGPSRM